MSDICSLKIYILVINGHIIIMLNLILFVNIRAVYFCILKFMFTYKSILVHVHEQNSLLFYILVNFYQFFLFINCNRLV